jgi:hypothetical protein
MVERAETTDFRPLKPWNPLDQLRLLWWLFMRPARFVDYEKWAGKEATHKVAIWLVSTLIWLSPFVVVLGIGLNLTHVRNRLPWDISLAMAGIIPLAWWLPGAIGTRNNRVARMVAGIMLFSGGNVVPYAAGSMIVTLVAFSSFVIAQGVLGRVTELLGESPTLVAIVTGGWVGVMVAGLPTESNTYAAAYCLASLVAGAGVFIVDGALHRSLQSGQSSRASKLILVVLALTYAVLVWVYLLGG